MISVRGTDLLTCSGLTFQETWGPLEHACIADYASSHMGAFTYVRGMSSTEHQRPHRGGHNTVESMQHGAWLLEERMQGSAHLAFSFSFLRCRKARCAFLFLSRSPEVFLTLRPRCAGLSCSP